MDHIAEKYYIGGDYYGDGGNKRMWGGSPKPKMVQVAPYPAKFGFLNPHSIDGMAFRISGG